MALNNLGVGIIFRATDLASAVVNKLGGSLGGLTNATIQGRNAMGQFTKGANPLGVALKQVGIGAGIAAAGIIGLTAAFKLAQPAGEFEQQLAAVGAVTRATAEEMGLLERTAIHAGIATQFSPLEAVEGLRSLATAGQTARQATATLIPVLDLAAGSLGQLGVAGAADAVVGTLNSYQFSADKAGEVTDKLLRITQLTNFQTRDFGVGLAKAAAAGSQFGQSLEDTLITVGLMRTANIDASSASTAFRESTRRLGGEVRAQNALTNVGVDVFDKLTGKMRALPDIMLDFSEKTKQMTEQQRNNIITTSFGARGLLAYNAVARAQATVMRDGREVTIKGAEAIAHLRKEMANTTGTAAKFREILLDTFEGQKTLLRGTVETIAIAIGKPFTKVLKPVVQAVVGFLNTMLKAFLQIPDGIKTAFAAFVVVASVTAIVVGLTMAFVGLLPMIIAAAGAMAELAAPVAIVLAGIAALIAAGAAIKTVWEANFGGIRDTILPIFEKISLAARSLFTLFTQGEISGALAEELTAAGNTGVIKFVDTISRAIGRVEAFFRGAFSVASVVFKNITKAFEPVFSRMSQAVSETFDVLARAFFQIGEALGLSGADQGVDAMERLGAVITAIVTGPLQLGIKIFAKFIEFGAMLVQKIVRVGSIIANVFGSAFQVVAGSFNALFGVITGNLTAVANGIASVLNGIVDFINDTLIEAAASTAEALGATDTAAALRGLKLDRFSGAQIEFSLTGDAKKLLAEQQRLLNPNQDVTSGRAPSSGLSIPSSGTSSNEGLIPTSQGGITGEGGQTLTGADMAALIDAFERRTDSIVRGQRITVEGRVELNGRAVGEMRALDEREQRSRTGLPQAAIGG